MTSFDHTQLTTLFSAAPFDLPPPTKQVSINALYWDETENSGSEPTLEPAQPASQPPAANGIGNVGLSTLQRVSLGFRAINPCYTPQRKAQATL